MRKLLAAALLLFAVTAQAGLKDLFSSQTTYWENDNFGIGRKSDRFYTNGAKVSLLLTDNPQLAEDFKLWFCKQPVAHCTGQYVPSTAFVFGQNFYTPQIITIAAPQPNDRPWAGWLYVGFAENITRSDNRIQHAFETHIGILGPGAGAQATQKYIHNDLGFSNHDPQGWPNQLKNEPTLDVSYRYFRRIGNDTIDVVPQFGAMVGSPQTFVNAGAIARVGWHITGFPVGLILPAVSPATKPHKFELYVFGGLEERYVPFNATLDGGLFRDGPKANGPKRLVGDFRRGVSARYKWVRLTYSVVDRTKEFDVPAGAIATQRFGSFALTLEPFNDFR